MIVAQKIGVREIPWFLLTLYLTGIYTLITVLTLFNRIDILNVIICGACVYMLLNKQNNKFKKGR